MRVEKLHDGEADIDDVLVRDLLAAQMPQWAELPLHLVEPAGTDNVMIRLGEALVVRLPRTPSAAEDGGKEQHLVPRIAPHLPIAVPAPVAVGEPQSNYPWYWSVCSWIDGHVPRPGQADPRLAVALAEFATALRGVDTFGLTAEGPLHSYRADPIRQRDALTRRCINQCDDLLDTTEVARAWDRVAQVPDHAGPPVWMHSDLHPGNLLVRGGALVAVIDWGGLSLGDPAVDCLAAWTLLDPSTRQVFRDHVDVDDDTWARGRAWALSIALVALPYYVRTDPQITAWARHAISQTVDDIGLR